MLTWSPLVLWLCACACRPAPEDTADSDAATVTTLGALTFTGPLPRNVLVLTLDTVRKDYLGRYGDHSNTPWLDGVLSESVVLEDHRSCSNWTVPAIICLYTGQTTVDLGVEPISSDPLAPNYAADIPFATTHLRDQGTATWFVSANGALTIWLDAEARVEGVFDHGFDGWWSEGDAPAAELVDATLAMIAAQPADTPWLGHVQVFDPHTPFDAPAEYLDGLAALDPIDFDLGEQDEHYRLSGLWETLDPEEQALVLAHIEVEYTAELRYMDDQLARLWSELDARGVLDDTLVLVWTDHGEQFFEHGYYMHDVSMYREEVDLAMGLWARGLAPATWTGPTRMVDLLPTIYSVIGQPLPDHLVGSVIGTAPGVRERFAFRYKTATTARQVLDYDGRRLIYDWTGERAYFESAQDPTEALDLYDPTVPRVAELNDLMAAETARIHAFLPHLTPVGHPVAPQR